MPFNNNNNYYYYYNTYFYISLLDRQIGEFVLTHADVKIPKRGKIYSFNEANIHEWDQPLQDYIDVIRRGIVNEVFL